MDSSLFSWSGLVITLLVAVVILAIAFVTVRGIVRFIQRRAPGRDDKPISGSL